MKIDGNELAILQDRLDREGNKEVFFYGSKGMVYAGKL